ncbi:MAG: cupin domain-containing protein [Candidatus Latescibacteria bacterium]|jgi:mannose-6-phosphate isomerase-like protein (cupin superfamily)|nr:cupin domain-containing protein [Candidatus Latescibacterota bacterium]
MENLTSFWITKLEKDGYNTPHKHTNEEHIYYTLKGSGRLVCGEREISVEEGDVGYFPKGVRHGFYNEADGESMFIGIAARVEPLE